jgi:hypothetical protein
MYNRRKRKAVEEGIDVNCNQCKYLRIDRVSYSFDLDTHDLQKEEKKFSCDKGRELYVRRDGKIIIKRDIGNCIDCHSFYNAYEKERYVPLMRAEDIKQMYSIWLDWMTWPLKGYFEK